MRFFACKRAGHSQSLSIVDAAICCVFSLLSDYYSPLGALTPRNSQSHLNTIIPKENKFSISQPFTFVTLQFLQEREFGLVITKRRKSPIKRGTAPNQVTLQHQRRYQHGKPNERLKTTLRIHDIVYFGVCQPVFCVFWIAW